MVIKLRKYPNSIKKTIQNRNIQTVSKKQFEIKVVQGEYGSDPEFPKTRVLQYSKERGQAYLLCSEWVQE